MSRIIKSKGDCGYPTTFWTTRGQKSPTKHHSGFQPVHKLNSKQDLHGLPSLSCQAVLPSSQSLYQVLESRPLSNLMQIINKKLQTMLWPKPIRRLLLPKIHRTTRDDQVRHSAKNSGRDCYVNTTTLTHSHRATQLHNFCSTKLATNSRHSPPTLELEQPSTI